MEKVIFKKIKYNELQALFVMISEFAKTIDIKESDLKDIAIGSVLHEFSMKKLKSILEGPKLTKYKISLPIHVAASIYIALQHSNFTDDFSKHVVRKFQSIIQEDFINRA